MRHDFYQTSIFGLLALGLMRCGTPTTPDASDAASDVAIDVQLDAIDAQDVTVDARPDRIFPDIHHDVIPDQVHRDGGTLTFTYVVSALTIDPTNMPDVPHSGLDVDQLFSDGNNSSGCQNPDYFAEYDNDQHCSMTGADGTCLVAPGCERGSPNCLGGVDNQMPSIANTLTTAIGYDLRAAMVSLINTSGIVLVFQLSDVDDLVDDPFVLFSLYSGYADFTDPCDSVLPDRTYSVSSSSLRPGGTTLADGAFQVWGSISHGRFVVAADSDSSFLIAIPITVDATPTFHLHELQVRADITDTGGTNGIVSGWVEGQELADRLIEAEPSFRTVIPSLVGPMCDVAINGVCSNVRTHEYGGISVGFEMRAVRAVIDPIHPVLDQSAAGVCNGP